jgi:hypothetical protein
MKFRKTPLLTVIFLAVSIACALAYVWLDPGRDVPDYHSLQEARGKVADFWEKSEGRGGQRRVEFRLVGGPRAFAYPSISQGAPMVAAALEANPHGEVLVKYLDWGKADGRGHYGTVWEISVNGKLVRSFAEVRQARRNNNLFGRWMFALFCVVFLFYASRSGFHWMRGG